MKKMLLLSICLCALPVMAQRTTECALTPLQNLIANARGDEEIQTLIAKGVVFDEQVRCGGTLMQLAVRRGNPAVLEAILRQDQRRANEVVTLDAFPISGAPKQIPLILFAAYYAPNNQIVELLIAAGAKIAATDDLGRNILWYLNKNPVLRNTALQDDLNNKLLYGMIAPQQTQDMTANAQAQGNSMQQAMPAQQPQQPVQQQAQPQAPNTVSPDKRLVAE